MKKYLLLLGLIWALLASSFPHTAKAQQDAQYTMYMFNGLALNPAYAGSRERTSATLLAREQWVGIEGAPSTQSFAIHAPFARQKMGAGLLIVNDRLGVTSSLTLKGAYSFRLNLGRSTLALGVQGGFTNYQADFNNVRHSISPVLLDPAFDQNINELLPNLGAGLFFNTERFYVGLSVPHMINNNLTNGISDARQSVHYFLTSGYVFDLNESIKLRPSFLVKYVESAPMSIDLNVNAQFFERFGLGLSYRVGDSIDFIFELPLTQNFTFAYAFDYTLSELGEYNSGSHELMVRYEFNLGGKRGENRIITPRYF